MNKEELSLLLEDTARKLRRNGQLSPQEWDDISESLRVCAAAAQQHWLLAGSQELQHNNPTLERGALIERLELELNEIPETVILNMDHLLDLDMAGE